MFTICERKKTHENRIYIHITLLSRSKLPSTIYQLTQIQTEQAIHKQSPPSKSEQKQLYISFGDPRSMDDDELRKLLHQLIRKRILRTIHCWMLYTGKLRD